MNRPYLCYETVLLNTKRGLDSQSLEHCPRYETWRTQDVEKVIDKNVLAFNFFKTLPSDLIDYSIAESKILCMPLIEKRSTLTVFGGQKMSLNIF